MTDFSILDREDLEELLRSTSRDNAKLDNELNECKENLERIQTEALASYNRLRRKNLIGGKSLFKKSLFKKKRTKRRTKSLFKKSLFKKKRTKRRTKSLFKKSLFKKKRTKRRTKSLFKKSLFKKKRTKRRTKSLFKKKRTKRRTKKLQFLYNPNNPKKSFDVYINKNPSDTIPIKYTTVEDVKRTIKKLESLFKRKAYPHKRIWQVGMILKVRLEAMKKHKKTKFPNAKNVTQRFNLANTYFKFLGKRSKLKTFKERKALVFKY